MADPKGGQKVSTFTKEEIINAASQFKTTPELMAGALHDVKDPLTKEDAEKRLAAFLKKPINNTK